MGLKGYPVYPNLPSLTQGLYYVATGSFFEIVLTSIALAEKKMKLCGVMRVTKDDEGSCLLACLFPCFP